jgi:hypothetical protein
LNQISKILAKEMKMYLRITFIFNDAIHRVEGGGGQLTKTQLAKNIHQVTKKTIDQKYPSSDPKTIDQKYPPNDQNIIAKENCIRG